MLSKVLKYVGLPLYFFATRLMRCATGLILNGFSLSEKSVTDGLYCLSLWSEAAPPLRVVLVQALSLWVWYTICVLF